MALSKWGVETEAGNGSEPPRIFHDSIGRQAVVSTALISIFRGRFCDLVLPNRKTTTFKKDDVIYNMGDEGRNFFFLQSGFVKVGAITTDGREVIYDVRQGGDVIGELCATEQVRPDRAVALEQTDAIAVPYAEIMDILRRKPELISVLIDVFSKSLKEAYSQVNMLALDDTVHRLIKILVGLATRIGRPSGSLVEIPTYLTQEEIAYMAAARRERISTALNTLRRQRMVHYSPRGHLVIDVDALESRLA
jgi:CRP/FNR family cyclic AMP-dependent transcriptional regulator